MSLRADAGFIIRHRRGYNNITDNSWAYREKVRPISVALRMSRRPARSSDKLHLIRKNV